ncbi:endonuclease V [Flavobacterium columnare]|uniref:Endonuclease V n=6 Tax=Flavobacteriaceae TaxID=49546 RepID=A0AA94F0M1_9FLAO|nr:endonuclease V [Flavobacterium columnare]MCH4829073.1 endonuclease V [Flavobacterium columnare]
MSKEIYSTEYELCYDFVLLNNFAINNRDRKQREVGSTEMLISRNDLDYEKLIANNQDIIDKYHSYDEKGYIEIDLDTFVYVHGDVERYSKVIVAYAIHNQMKEYLGKTIPDTFMEKFVWQEEQIGKTINEDQLPTDVQFIGGVTVAYHDITQKIVAVVTVMNVNSQEIVDQAIYTEDRINMHIPDVFGFNETIWAIKAFEKLTIKPQLIFCDGHGIEHPKNMGFATFLGIQLDIPTIGCAKKRLVGYYKKEDLGTKRADNLELVFDQKIVGKALRTKENTNPIYVSIGHKISLETSVNWVLKTTQSTRLPFVLEKAIEIARQQLPEQFRIDFMNDEPNEYGIIK